MKFRQKTTYSVALFLLAAASTVVFYYTLPGAYFDARANFSGVNLNEFKLVTTEVQAAGTKAETEELFSPAIKSKILGSYNNPKVSVSNCTDCFLYPVDKEHALPSSYIPKVVNTGLLGGGQMTVEARDNLAQLFALANQKGMQPKVNSSYRSYSTQSTTFDYWVQKEMAKGKTREEAEISANTFSARPGHSEHQLGTTADVNCGNCTAFDRKNQENWKIWTFLAENAHNYGFVISYPEGKESLTGYVYEPWHLRYVGKDIAMQIYALDYLSPSTKTYPTKFLAENWAKSGK